MPTTITKKQIRKPQKQQRPGSEQKMQPKPVFDYPQQKGSNKLHNKIALITGGDSGIGKAAAILFAKEGAHIAISYLSEKKDADETKKIIEQQYHKQCLLIAGDIAKEKHCKEIVKETIRAFGRIDILVNNAGLHFENKSLEKMSTREMLKTFETNVFSMFWITRACLPYMKKGSCIINSASVTAYRGSASLMDYAATKGAIVSFTRSLSANLIKKGIRVNGVAPCPVWTPLIASSFKSKKVAQHGSNSPMERAGQPVEIAPSYLFLACSDSGYMSGQFLHPNGGEIVNG